MSVSRYAMPPCLTGTDGQDRRVGVEIEMSGIELSVIAAELSAVLGGKTEVHSDYELEVRESRLGDFKIDLDFEYLQKMAHRHGQEAPDWSREFELLAADTLQALLKNLIPCELITPPLAFHKLPELDEVVKALRQRGAQGTRQALFATFGLHLNPELPDLEAETILAYLRAFIGLREWLEEREKVVLSRKLSLFIRPFPAEYEALVMSAEYAPTLAELTRDYLTFNATRNRMLDLLPLLAHLDEEAVTDAIKDQKLRKRPTLHYRLPNSDIDNPEWGIWRSWNDWMQVEWLVHERERLEELCTAWRRSRRGGYLSGDFHSWKETVKEWLIDPTSR